MSEETGRQRKKTQRARRLRVPLDEVPRQSSAGVETTEPEGIAVPIVHEEDEGEPITVESDEPPPPAPPPATRRDPEASVIIDASAFAGYAAPAAPAEPPPPPPLVGDALAAIAPESIAPSVRTPPPAPSPPSRPPEAAAQSSVVVSRVVITGAPPPMTDATAPEVHAPRPAALPRARKVTSEPLDDADLMPADAPAEPAASIEARATDPDGEPAFGEEASTEISIEEVPIGTDDDEGDMEDMDELAAEPTIVRPPREEAPAQAPVPAPVPVVAEPALVARSEPAPARPLSSPPRPLSSPPRPLSSPPRPLSSPPRPLSSPPRPFSQPPLPVVEPPRDDEHETDVEAMVPTPPPPEPDETIEPEDDVPAAPAAALPPSPPAAMIPPPPAPAAAPPPAPAAAPPPAPAAAHPPPPPVAAARAVPPAPPPAAAKATKAAPPATPAEAHEPEEPVRKKRKAWWETFFNDDYLRTVRPPRPAQVMRQVNFIEFVLGLQPGGTVLDVGCGLGLQAVELASRGYLVVGVDLSLPMLSRAADEAQDAGQKINFLHADMRELSFDGTFDAVMSLGTSFGYFDDDMNKNVLERMKKALKPGGVLLLDTVNRDFVLQQQPNLVWFEGDGCVCMEETQFNYITSRLHVKRTVILDDGRQRENEYAIRLYTLSEIGQILHHMGFRVMEVSGNEATPGVHFGAFSSKLIILAEKRADLPMTATPVSSAHRESPSQPGMPRPEASPPRTPPPPPMPKDDKSAQPKDDKPAQPKDDKSAQPKDDKPKDD